MLNSIILLGGLVSAFGLGAINPIQEKQDNIQFKLENHKSVIYDDSNYTITLSADELNNYVFTNLADYLNDNESLDLSGSSLLEGVNNYSYDYFVVQDSVNYRVDLLLNAYQTINFNLENGLDNFAKFNLFFSSSNSYVDFSNDIVWDLASENLYNSIKPVIELDIQANSQFPATNFLGDIVSLLTGGIVGLATGLGAGVSDLVSNIFINNGSLSVFGYMVVIFAGIALAIGLSRWVMNFLTSLGAKK